MLELLTEEPNVLKCSQRMSFAETRRNEIYNEIQDLISKEAHKGRGNLSNDKFQGR